MLTARNLPWVITVLASVGAVALALLVGSDPIGQAGLAARWTARAGFPLLILTYSASSLVRIWPNDGTRALLRWRRQWGLGFALVHIVHLVALTTLNILIGEVPDASRLIGGGGAYVLLFAMVLTSNDASMRAMGIWWKRLHTLGIHWLWAVFTFSYFGRMFDPARMTQGLIFFPVCLAALGLRLMARAKSRRALA